MGEKSRSLDYLKKDHIDEYVREFHDACDGKKTLVIVKGLQGQLFGGYTDIPWTNSGSTSKVHLGQSFIFVHNEEHNGNPKDMFKIFPVNTDQPETYHSNDYGPNFLELKLKGADDFSEMTANGKSYDLPQGLITNSRPDAFGRQLFKYSMLEVFEVTKQKIEPKMTTSPQAKDDNEPQRKNFMVPKSKSSLSPFQTL